MYFAMVVLVALIPLVYVVIMAYTYFPRPPHLYLTDPSVASFLGINLTEQPFALAAFYPGRVINNFWNSQNYRLKFLYFYQFKSDLINGAFYFNIASCVVAYMVILILGWRMHRFVRLNLKGIGSSQKRARELNAQLTLTLVIQVIYY